MKHPTYTRCIATDDKVQSGNLVKVKVQTQGQSSSTKMSTTKANVANRDKYMYTGTNKRPQKHK